MKRLHVHVAVENLQASIRFYSELFAAEPRSAGCCEPAAAVTAAPGKCCG